MRSVAIRRCVVAAGLVLGSGLFGFRPDAAQAIQNPSACPNRVQLVNGDFEAPVLGPSSFSFFPSASVGWSTSDSSDQVELWSDNFLGGSPYRGRQWAELEAFAPAQISQSLATTPGQTLYWRLAHTSRGAGADVAQVRIGSAAEGIASPVALTDTGISQISDSNQEWGQYRGVYVVPPGQTQTHFGVEVVSNSWGAGGGNHLDDVVIETPACVIVSKQAFDASGNLLTSNATVQVDDVITYRVSAVNRGGVAAVNARITDVLPTGVAFVPGSLRVLSGPGVGNLTDAAGDDLGQVSGQTISVAVGAGATPTTGGSLATDETLVDGTTIEFQARVLSAPGGLTRNAASLRFDDTLSGVTNLEATSNDVDVQVPTTSTTITTTATTTTTLATTTTTALPTVTTTVVVPGASVPVTVVLPGSIVSGDPIVLPPTAPSPSVSSATATPPTTTNPVVVVVDPGNPTGSSPQGAEPSSEDVLAFTGLNTPELVALASVSLIAGGVLVSRSRRSTSQSPAAD